MKRYTVKPPQGITSLGSKYGVIQDVMDNPNELFKLFDKLGAYEDTGLEPDLIEELKAKQKPKKAVWKKGFFGGYSCPNCKEIFTAKKSPYCSICGQAIDWEN